MKLRDFIRNVEHAIDRSFFLSFLYIAFMGIFIVGVVAFVLANPTVEVFSALGALLIARIVYAGFTGD